MNKLILIFFIFLSFAGCKVKKDIQIDTAKTYTQIQLDSITSGKSLEYEEIEREYSYSQDTSSPSAPIHIKEKIKRLKTAENASSVKKDITEKLETKSKSVKVEKTSGTVSVNFILFAVLVVAGIYIYFRLK